MPAGVPDPAPAAGGGSRACTQSGSHPKETEPGKPRGLLAVNDHFPFPPFHGGASPNCVSPPASPPEGTGPRTCPRAFARLCTWRLASAFTPSLPPPRAHDSLGSPWPPGPEFCPLLPASPPPPLGLWGCATVSRAPPLRSAQSPVLVSMLTARSQNRGGPQQGLQHSMLRSRGRRKGGGAGRGGQMWGTPRPLSTLPPTLAVC